jgi:hypothetical protein
MSGPTPPPVQGLTTCQGTANTTATPSLDPTAANLLQQYLSCVTARGWCKVVLETRGGLQRFDFSCQPSPTSSQRAPAEQQGCKRQTKARRCAQENLKRTQENLR